jgi:hypothetical protein
VVQRHAAVPHPSHGVESVSQSRVHVPESAFRSKCGRRCMIGGGAERHEAVVAAMRDR